MDGTIPRKISSLKEITFRDIEPDFASRNRLKIKLHHPEWFSVFHSHQQYAGAFKYKRCFIIGDAAHVFSPVGAQGMNTGMQDAYNLAWKLAMSLEGYSNESLLGSYQKERQPLARNMIKSTDHFFRIVTGSSNMDKKIRLQLAPFLLKVFFPIIEKQKIISRYLFKGISEIGINYRKSPLSSNSSQGYFSLNAPKPGDRLPYVLFNQGGKELNLQDIVNGTFFHLIIFSRSAITLELSTYIRQYSGWLMVHHIPPDDGNRSMYKRLGMGKTGCYLIRPDMYIAYRAKKLNIEKLERYLKKLSIVTPASTQGNN